MTNVLGTSAVALVATALRPQLYDDVRSALEMQAQILDTAGAGVRAAGLRAICAHLLICAGALQDLEPGQRRNGGAASATAGE